MRSAKKLIATFLTLALLLGCIPCSTTVQAAAKVPKTLTFYFTKIHYENGIRINGWHNIPRASVKSSNNDILQIRSSTKTLGKDGKFSWISFIAKKPGTSTISFKMDGKRYKTKIIIKKYVNPVKSVSITGIKNGNKTELASLTDGSISSPKIELKKTVKNPKLKITAANGWKLNSIFYFDAAYKDQSSKYYKKPVAKATVKIFNKIKALKKNTGGYYIQLNFVNTKNKATVSLSYYIDKDPN